MGYTHYWYKPLKIDEIAFKKFSDDVKIIVAEVDKTKVKLAGIDGKGKPVIEDDYVGLNGRGKDAFESFVIQQSVQPQSWQKLDSNGCIFDFCKTGRRPYDVVVAAILIAFKKHFGDAVKVNSDGDDSEWEDARELCYAALEYGRRFSIESDFYEFEREDIPVYGSPELLREQSEGLLAAFQKFGYPNTRSIIIHDSGNVEAHDSNANLIAYVDNREAGDKLMHWEMTAEDSTGNRRYHALPKEPIKGHRAGDLK